MKDKAAIPFALNALQHLADCINGEMTLNSAIVEVKKIVLQTLLYFIKS